jgi:hypothetical protein
MLYTITDGAVRMLVLLHAYNKGFDAMQVRFPTLAIPSSSP